MSTKIIEELIQEIPKATTLEELEEKRLALLGKSGLLTSALKALKTLDAQERRQLGERINHLKENTLQALESSLRTLQGEALKEKLASENLDLTLPPFLPAKGRLHPIPTAIEEILAIFSQMGFDSVQGPHIEDDFHNFSALNIPDLHPSRQLMDTFYLPPDENGKTKLLRTHTSGVQIRTLLKKSPPLRIVSAGRVFRSDYDQTHTPNFHQVELLVIEPNIHMGHLKGVISEFCRRFFNLETIAMRFRPNHFPFTEPSAEVDIQAQRSEGKVTLGVGKDWLEVLGCGMVHPKVLENCGIDPKVYQGFALGMGVERMAMLKYGISDLRAFYDSDLRWLSHFGFAPHEAALREPRSWNVGDAS